MINNCLIYVALNVFVDNCRSDAGKDCLPVLWFIVEHGNVTVFEWQRGKQPTRVDAAETELDGCSEDEDDVKDDNNCEVSDVHLVMTRRYDDG